MGKPVIKMLKMHYGTDSDIEKLLKYIAGEGKNAGAERLLKARGKGTSHKASKAAEQMIAAQKATGKTTGRRMYHMVISFPHKMQDKAMIQEAADVIAEKLFENYQVFYGIHLSKENWHIHFAINAVSYRTGNKWHQNNQEFRDMKEEFFKCLTVKCCCCNPFPVL